MAYIYQIQNDVNGKLYVGKTEFSIEKRFKEHCKDAFKDRNEKRPLYSAMRKYGIEHFQLVKKGELVCKTSLHRGRVGLIPSSPTILSRCGVVGNALVLGTRDREFKSLHFDHFRHYTAKYIISEVLNSD